MSQIEAIEAYHKVRSEVDILKDIELLDLFNSWALCNDDRFLEEIQRRCEEYEGN